VPSASSTAEGPRDHRRRKNVSPSQIETGLRASPYVSDAVVFGEGRKYLAALIEMDYETVAEWARERGLTHTGYASLAAHPEVTRLLDAEIRARERVLRSRGAGERPSVCCRASWIRAGGRARHAHAARSSAG